MAWKGGESLVGVVGLVGEGAFVLCDEASAEIREVDRMKL